MSPRPSHRLQVTAAEAAKLTSEQKKFNTLTQRIAKERDLLRDWEAAMLTFRQRVDSEMRPLTSQQDQVRIELVRLLDQLSDQKLAKADRAHLDAVICSLTETLLDRLPDDDDPVVIELKAIFSRHADDDYDSAQEALDKEHDAMARAMAREVFGVELDGDEPLTPEAVMQMLEKQFEEQEREQQSAAEQRAAHASARKSQRAKKPTARELKQQQDAKAATQSVREIYRKLASELHPDREPDAVERERKTALMQRVNRAYDAGNLLQLLELQLELEHLDSAKMAGLGDEKLKHYNKVLAEQFKRIQQEIDELLQSFLFEFQLPPFESYTPKKIGKMLSEDIAAQASALHQLKVVLMELVNNPADLKPWLKADRENQRRMERAMRDEFNPFF
ncbi:MAG: J domain-containing protein [Burkholderiaceae bacterium]|jgi:hypothetical protein|nr:J domain-containing protein [Burkholderiaceae bacterium]